MIRFQVYITFRRCPLFLIYMVKKDRTCEREKFQVQIALGIINYIIIKKKIRIGIINYIIIKIFNCKKKKLLEDNIGT